MIKVVRFLHLPLLMTLTGCAIDKTEPSDFDNLAAEPNWQLSFSDSGDGDWKQHWFADGKQNTISNDAKGMTFNSGDTEWDPAHHGVLWTKPIFEGDVKISYQYTRHDTEHKWVNILYIQASGVGEGEYAEDIQQWQEMRQVPMMKTYFNHMNALHISYAAYGKEDKGITEDYVRARRYPVKPGQVFRTDTAITGDYFNTGLFVPGNTYQITVIKKQHDLYMKIEGDNLTKLFKWDTSQFPLVNKGRIGLRHMWRKSVTYKNFKVYEWQS